MEKKKGKLQKYNPDKIIKGILKCGATKSQAKSILKTVEKELLVIPTSKIRKVVLRELKSKNPKAYREWLAYDRKRK